MTESDNLANQWRSISALLDEALLLPVTEHPRWLADLPASVAHLRETLRHFLELHAQVEGNGFLGQPAVPLVDAEAQAPMLLPGELVGSYRIIGELGSGGMGSVWLAERADGKPRRRVALKLPRMVWASDLPERLERERDILAPLEHPNVARLYDAGIDEKGRPFLAIEYVEGVRITDYCSEHKLDVRQRIRLFMQVLSAVQYAHTRLVLHRDLKPANILVNHNGDVRLLDFGIAKLLDDVTATSESFAAITSRALTPRYASPEQLRDDRLSLVSDVYSLGVVLHELLTGVSPYPPSAKSRAEIELAVLEGVIAPPSRRVTSPSEVATSFPTGISPSQILRGDLDAVILKSLSLDPAKRYSSVEALAADLDRWLTGRPVLAMPPSLLAAAKKFVLRNRIAVAVSTTASLAVLVMTGVAVYQADKAILESDRAAATRDFLIHMFESANPELNGGREATVRELVSSAEDAVVTELDGQAIVQAEMLGSLVNVWLNLGDLYRADHALNKKIVALKNTDEVSALVAAQVDRIVLLLSLNRLSAAFELVSEVSSPDRYGALSRVDQARVTWARAWIDLSNSQNESALDRFKKAERLALSADSKGIRVSALYGQSLAYMQLRDRMSASASLRSATDLFERLDDADGHALVGALEITAAHLSLGLYEDGWRFLNQVTENGFKGDFSSFRRSAELNFYWAFLGVKLNKFDQEEKERISKSDLVIKSEELGLKKKLLQGSILVDLGEFDKAEEVFRVLENYEFNNIYEKNIQVKSKRLWASLKNGQSVQSKKHSESIEAILSGSVISEESAARANWILGIYHLSLNDLASAADRFHKSSEIYRIRFGNEHPAYLECALAAALVEFLGHKGSIDNFDFNKIESLASLLRLAYPEEHRVVRYASLLAKGGSEIPIVSQKSGRHVNHVTALLDF